MVLEKLPWNFSSCLVECVQRQVSFVYSWVVSYIRSHFRLIVAEQGHAISFLQLAPE